MPNRIQCTVIYTDPAFRDELEPRLKPAGVEAVHARVEDLDIRFDAIVTAGNAYGLMSAGFDAAVIRIAGAQLEARVQDRIASDYLGEQPVGTAFVIDAKCATFPHLVHAPTMRTPGCIRGTDKVYTSTWASLLAIYNFNRRSEEHSRPKINRVLLPLMGAGFGRVEPSESARQMAAAITHLRHPQRVKNWDLVVGRERSITHDGGVAAVR